jgi:hypothetical protein
MNSGDGKCIGAGGAGGEEAGLEHSTFFETIKRITVYDGTRQE